MPASQLVTVYGVMAPRACPGWASGSRPRAAARACRRCPRWRSSDGDDHERVRAQPAARSTPRRPALQPATSRPEERRQAGRTRACPPPRRPSRREALGQQVAAEEVEVHEHERAEQLRQLHEVVLVRAPGSRTCAARRTPPARAPCRTRAPSDTNQGARSAVCHISWACCRPKIQAVTEWTRTAHTSAITLDHAQGRVPTPCPPRGAASAHRYTHGQDQVHRQHDDVPHERRRPGWSTRTAPTRAGAGPGPPPRSRWPAPCSRWTSTTATLEMPPKPLMPNALAAPIEMMRPPAERPTKNMKHGDVEAPGVQVPHGRLRHAAGELHGPERDAHNRRARRPPRCRRSSRGRPSRSASPRPSPVSGRRGPGDGGRLCVFRHVSLLFA